LEGECVQQLDGHTSFVYSVDVLSTGEFVSSGEDRTVRIWKGKPEEIRILSKNVAKKILKMAKTSKPFNSHVSQCGQSLLYQMTIL
jgi:WD40 repeat protein